MPIDLVINPSRPQHEFLTATARYVAYGGARGGGKSWAVRQKARIMALAHPGIRILIVRRTFPELQGNHILPMMHDMHGLGTYRDSDKTWTLSNGSRIKYGHFASELDAGQYQGQEYDIVFIDEATQFTENQFAVLDACTRGVRPFPRRTYLTCNPGGVGHAWVKRLFVDRQYRGEERPEDYVFIRASLFDNAVLMQNDPGYVRSLKNLPEHLRRAWLEGDWDALAGQYFDMFRRDVHVIEPFDIPAHWRRYFAMDYGLDMLAGLWAAFDDRNNCYIYREIYEPKLLVSEAAERIRAVDDAQTHLAPPDLWNKHSDTGRSTAEIFAAAGVGLIRASNDRVQGWYDVGEWLRVVADEQGRPTAHLRIFKHCENLIRTLPAIQRDERRPNDCAREPHELTHAPDALRYLLAGRPCAAYVPTKAQLRQQADLDDFFAYGR